MTRRSVSRLVAVLLLFLAVAACVPAEDEVVPARSVPSPSAHQRAERFTLYTHCGIHELTVDGRWYERVGGILDDGNANPPPGWGNPHQEGTLTRMGSTVVFQDELGHYETFRLRPGATSAKSICQ